jgi:hypothetical protein
MTSPTDYAGPGETPHDYHPDVMAMGDCSVCGHTYAAHFPPASLPQPEELVERLVAYAGPVRMDNGCGGDLAAEAADAITSLSQRLAVAEGAEDEAKDLFWAIYPDWVKTNGRGLSVEAGRTLLGERLAAAEAALAHARKAAIEECAKVLDEMALRAAVDLDTDKQSRDPSILFRVRDMATHLYTGAAAALRAIQGSGKP